MRVLLTGATGFVGAHTLDALLRAGHSPRVLVRSTDRLRANAGALGIDTDAVDVVIGDMTDEAAVTKAVDGCDATIHAAAVVAALNRGDAQRTIDVNLDGTRTVLGAALTAGCDPVVHVSSVAALFDPKVRAMHSDLPPATGAASPYTRSKALAEEHARGLQARGHPVVTVYPGGVAGPPAGAAAGDVAEGFVSMLKTGFLALDDGGFALIDVRDLALVLVAALEPGAGPRRFMAGGRFVSLTEIGHMLQELTGRRMPILPTPGAVFRGLGRVVDSVRRVLPFETVFTAEAMQLLTLAQTTDDSAVHEQLGVTYRPAVESIEAMVRGLHAAGRLTDKQVGRLAR
jgi:dihydroflavonol-4-reductase